MWVMVKEWNEDRERVVGMWRLCNLCGSEDKHHGRVVSVCEIDRFENENKKSVCR